MRLAWVELRDLRNHVETRLDELPEGLITVAGPNGEGKTNLLEGIAFLFFLQSPRTSSTEPVVRRDAEGPAYARGEILTEDQAYDESVLLGVRLAEGLSIERLRPEGRRSVAGLLADGLVERGAALRGRRIVLTLRGRLLADAVVRRLVLGE